MTDVSLTVAEAEAQDTIILLMGKIRALSKDGNPANFEGEVIPAIHTLQMFVLMHWAHRIHPKEWSDWFWEDEENPGMAALRRLDKSKRHESDT